MEENVVLEVTKAFTDDSVLAGTSGHTFTISVKNSGTSDAENVNVSDSVDPRLVVTGTSGDFSCGAPSQTLDCDLSELGAGETKTITVTYSVDADTVPAASVANTASATSDEVPTAVDSNTDSVEIATEADLSIEKTGPATATAGDPAGFDYTIKVHNNGPSDNTGGFTVSDTLPAGLTFETTGSDTAARRPASSSRARIRPASRPAPTRRSPST